MEKQECETRGSRVNEIVYDEWSLQWELKWAQIDEYDLRQAQHDRNTQ